MSVARITQSLLINDFRRPAGRPARKPPTAVKATMKSDFEPPRIQPIRCNPPYSSITTGERPTGINDILYKIVALAEHLERNGHQTRQWHNMFVRFGDDTLKFTSGMCRIKSVITSFETVIALEASRDAIEAKSSPTEMFHCLSKELARAQLELAATKGQLRDATCTIQKQSIMLECCLAKQELLNHKGLHFAEKDLASRNGSKNYRPTKSKPQSLKKMRGLQMLRSHWAPVYERWEVPTDLASPVGPVRIEESPAWVLVHERVAPPIGRMRLLLRKLLREMKDIDREEDDIRATKVVSPTVNEFSVAEVWAVAKSV